MTYFYHSVVDSPHLPRDLAADSTQSAIITLLGEFWPHDAAVEVPSAAIAHLMRLVGSSEAATRAALSRLGKRGTLVASKDGRRTSYRLSDEVLRSIPASEYLTMNFGASPRLWSGEWTIVVYSLPESMRDRRDALREWLRWLGFGPCRDGVWAAPNADIDLVTESVGHLFPDDVLIFRTSDLQGNIEPSAVWNLPELRTIYDEFIGEFRPAIYKLRAGAMAPYEALPLTLRLLGRWRGFPTVDPDLPRRMLPADWPRDEARRVFTTLYDSGMPTAARLVRRVTAKYDEAAADAVRTMTTDEVLAELRRRAEAAPSQPPNLQQIGPRLYPVSAAS